MKHIDLYIDIVKNLAKASKDGREKVGAILLKNGRIVATGYNGQLSGEPNEPIMVDGHDISTVHSEQNIIAFCAKEGISTEGTEILITHSPCVACTKLLIQSGVKRVYYLKEYRIDENPLLKKINHTCVYAEETPKIFNSFGLAMIYPKAVCKITSA